MPDSPAHPPHIQNAPSIGVKPESPRYIRVPQSLQPTIEKDVFVKGTLPRQRDIFSARKGGFYRARARVAWMNRPRSAPQGQAPKQQTEILAYKERMADMRRQNLREGVIALAGRKLRKDERSHSKSMQKAQERARLLNAPPAEADRLTRTSQTHEMTAPLKHSASYIADSNAEERRRLKVERYEAQRTAKAAQTQEALHTLYMQARDFIVTEEQLDKEIDAVFGTQEQPAAFRGRDYERSGAEIGPSIWVKGAPPSLRNKLEATGQASGATLSARELRARSSLYEKRMKKVAEKLTGGKM